MKRHLGDGSAKDKNCADDKMHFVRIVKKIGDQKYVLSVDDHTFTLKAKTKSHKRLCKMEPYIENQ